MLIVGLGNPGKKYEKTRHNVGHMVVAQLETLRLASLAQGRETDFILAKTDTFMNLSGKAVKKLTKSYKLKAERLMIVHDDIDIPVGAFKIQKGRGAAGHKGVQSIINELKTKDFWRARIGICPKKGKPENVEKFVLQNFTKEEEKILKEVIGAVNKKLKLSPQLS